MFKLKHKLQAGSTQTLSSNQANEAAAKAKLRFESQLKNFNDAKSAEIVGSSNITGTSNNAAFSAKTTRDNTANQNKQTGMAVGNAAKATAARKENTPPIRQADISVQPLFNLGY